MEPRRRRILWLILACILLTGGALFMSLFDEPPLPPPQVTLPRHMDQAAHERMTRRRMLSPRLLPTTASSKEKGPVTRSPRMRDPLISAMPATVKKAAIIVEANALRYSPVGELFINCLMQREPEGLERLKQKSGVDPLKDLDRIAFVDDTLILSGNFAQARFTDLIPNSQSSQINDHTTLYQQSGKEVMAVWRNQIIVTGKTLEAIQPTLDRLEGKTSVDSPVIAEQDSYGEIYGLVSPQIVAQLFPNDQPELAQRLSTVADRIALHVDASKDIGIVADVTGPNPADIQDLAKALGTAFSLARFEAQRRGQHDIAQALDYARTVTAKDGKFRTELGLPLEIFKSRLQDCTRRSKPEWTPSP